MRQSRSRLRDSPFKVLKMLFNHPLTTKGIDQFNADWAKYMEAKK